MSHTYNRRHVLGLLAGLAGAVQLPAVRDEKPPDNIAREAVGTQETDVDRQIRETAQRAVDQLRAEGIEIDDTQAGRIVDGTVAGLTDTELPAVSIEHREAIAEGSSTGTVLPLRSYSEQLTTDQLFWAAYGSALGTALAVSNAAEADRTLRRESVFATAVGAAEGAVAETGVITQDSETSVDPAVTYGAAGGAADGVATHSSQDVSLDIVYVAVLAASSGTVRGVSHRTADGQPLQLDPTLGAAAGAASGGIEAAAENTSALPDLVFEAVYAAAIGSLSQQQFTEYGSAYEFAFQSAFGVIAPPSDQQPPETIPDDPFDPQPAPEPDTPDEGDQTPFGEPIVVDSFSPPIGPPRDLTGDGLYEDIDGTGEVDYIDVVKLSQIVDAYDTGLIVLTDEQIAALDFNGDGVLDLRDVKALDEQATG